MLQESNSTFTMKDQLKQSLTDFIHQNRTGMIFTKQKQLEVELNSYRRTNTVRELNKDNSKLQPLVESIGMTGKLINGEEAPVFPLNNWMNVIKNKTQLAVIAGAAYFDTWQWFKP
ncbi:hypothetical protein ACTFIY_002718 [Dictyostelium cf. discoideum]